MTVRYGVLEGKPVLFTDNRAYWYIDGWRFVDAAEVAMHGKELSPADFARRFPSVQPDMTLFQEAGSVT